VSFTVDVPLRWGDMDAQGHVNNAGFVDYLQEARVDFLLASPVPYLLGGGIIVVSHQIEYRAPVSYSTSPVVADVTVAAVKGAVLELAYTLSHDGDVAAVARTTLCPYDFEQGRVRRLTSEERGYFASQLEPVELLRPSRRLAVDARAMETSLRVRWSDLDSYGHVNNVKFFDYVQEGRIAFSEAVSAEMARTRGQGTADYMWMVVRQDVDYVTQLEFRLEPYKVATGVANIGTTSMSFCSEIRDDAGIVYARAATTVVCADQTGRPAAIPEPWRRTLAPYMLG
jgi:acyl-CoA thioester hydrolase